MQRLGRAKTFDRGDLVAIVKQRQTQTRIDAAAIYMNRAGAALTVVASFFGSRQPDVLAEAIQQRSARIDPQRVRFVIDPQRDRQGAFNFGATALCWARPILFGSFCSQRNCSLAKNCSGGAAASGLEKCPTSWIQRARSRVVYHRASAWLIRLLTGNI